MTWCVDKAYIEDLLLMKQGVTISDIVQENLADIGFYKIRARNYKSQMPQGIERKTIETNIAITQLGQTFIYVNGL